MLIIFETPTDEDLFIYLHNKYKKLLYKYAYDILKNHYDCEDALQMTWISFANNIVKFRKQNERKTVNFLITVTRNNAINLYNKKNKLVEFADAVILNSANHFNEIYMMIEKEDLKMALRSIDDTYLEPLLLKYTYGYSIKEITAFYNITETNVGTRIYRAKAMLKELLSERRGNDER
ncbi:MAG: sigma-70 family RNA polymerase sigma factor [Firmicutes bacterium]|nr:sigma-70 family RNA polymerase sigma factor [Bacillota bacterium]